MKSLLKRSESIDRHMDDYQNIIQDTERAERTLAASSLVHFIIAAAVLSVAIGGAMINFSLIARPMSEMVGGTNMVGGFRTADIAALVIIFVEMSMGLFLMESLRITRLFPIIGALPDKTRVRMIWATFTILLALACVEVGLAYMREMLLQDELATNALLRGGSRPTDMQNSFEWITMFAQMGMGFVLPFALIFVAIPLETFVLSSRNVFGAAAAGLLKAFAFSLRLLATGCRYGGAVLVEAYDVLIFGPLWLETMIKTRVADRASRAHQGGPAMTVKRRLARSLPPRSCSSAAAGPESPITRASIFLMDTSGTYAQQLDKAQHIIDVVLSRLQPGRLFRRRPGRHRELHREGHHRDGQFRRPPLGREPPEAGLPQHRRAISSRR